MDQATCMDACKTLNFPQKQILGGYKCYKGGSGDCNQNGHNGPGASLLCRKSEKSTG